MQPERIRKLKPGQYLNSLHSVDCCISHAYDAFVRDPDVIVPHPRGYWLAQTQLDEQWTAVGYFWPVDGSMRLAELRIAPTTALRPVKEADDPFDDWGDVDKPSLLAAMPADTPGAIYPQLLRKVPLAHWQATVTEGYAFWASYQRDERVTTTFLDRYATVTATDAQLVTLLFAKTYAQHAGRMSNPNPVVAAQLGLTSDEVSKVRDRLTSARRLGYLQRAGRGRAGGTLTPLGQALADKYDDELRKIKRRMKRGRKS
jgi:hypothetical protein